MRKKNNRYRSSRRKPGRVLVAWLKTAAIYVMAFSSVVLFSAGLSHSYYALLEAPWLLVEDIEISGLKHLSRTEVLNSLGVPRNTSVLSLKMSELATRADTLPWVKSAVVRLDLPRRLVVEVIEREPLAVIQAEDLFILDEEGKLFLKADEKSTSELFHVTGFSGLKLAQGSILPAESLEALKTMLAALQKSRGWLPPDQILECRWHKDEGFILFTTHKAIPVELGWDNFDQKLGRLKQVFGMLAERQLMDLVTRIDLDYSNRAYIGGNFPTPKGI